MSTSVSSGNNPSLVVTPSDAQVLTNKDFDGGTATNASRLTLPKATKAALDTLARKEGTVVYATDLDKVYKDDGVVLTELGSGGGEINLLENGDAETGVLGWLGYTDAAGTIPVDGTGGAAPSITFTRNTTSPLNGNGDFKFSKPASNCQGQGWAYEFTVPRKYAAKVLRNICAYRTTTNYVDGDVGIHLYRVTATAKYIQVDRINIDASEYGDHLSSWQTEASSANDTYRLIIHQQSTSALAYDIFFDDFVVGPSQVAVGVIIKKQHYSVRQLQNAMIDRSAQLEFDLGTATIINLGDNLITAVDDPANTRTKFIANQDVWINARVHATSAITQSVQIRTFDSGGTIIYDYQSTTSYTSDSNTEGNAHFKLLAGQFFCMNGSVSNIAATASLEFIAFSYTNQAVSEDYGQRHILTTLLKSATQSINNATETKVSFSSASKDTVAAFDEPNDRIVIKESGDYDVLGVIQFASTATGGKSIHVRKNGSITDQGYMWYNIGSASAGAPSNVSGHTLLTNLVVGDYLEFWAAQDSGGALNINGGNTTFTVAKRQSNQQIAASEIVKASYSSNSGQSIPHNTVTIVNYEDRETDSHGAATVGASWKYTLPVSGAYFIEAMIGFTNTNTWAIGEDIQLSVYKNNVYYKDLYRFDFPATAGSSIYTRANGSASLEGIKGDYFDIRIYQFSGGSLSLVVSPETVRMSVHKIGGVA